MQAKTDKILLGGGGDSTWTKSCHSLSSTPPDHNKCTASPHPQTIDEGVVTREMSVFLRSAKKALEKYIADVKKATTPRGFDFRDELMLWNFTQEDTWKSWDCISDKDVKGNSIAQFEPNGKGSSQNCWPCLMG